MNGAEQKRLQDNPNVNNAWYYWGPYLSERQWGTVREDYSADGDANAYFPHDHARSRAYRWGEDGLMGLSDWNSTLCFAPALWNGQDPILKERLFGLSNPEGNHGEDVKEYYFYLDNTPTHSYMKALYKYPHSAFPYQRLVDEGRHRSRSEPEFELLDTGAFDDNRYFDIVFEYAKCDPYDLCIRITATNRGSQAAPLYLLPTIWFRNTWSWDERNPKPELSLAHDNVIFATSPDAGQFYLHFQGPRDTLFTENKTNSERLHGIPNRTPYVKDAFHRFVVGNQIDAVNPNRTGTKAAPLYVFHLEGGESVTVKLRLKPHYDPEALGPGFDSVFAARIAEADDFYHTLNPVLAEDARLVQRQAYAGLLWTKQYYYFDVDVWLRGDPSMPRPPVSRLTGRNTHWKHLYISNIISMPDKWEYPYFCAWDTSFHTVAFALIDPAFAKRQISVLLHDSVMHVNGSVPAYEWGFDDANPPVQAWAVWRVYSIDRRRTGQGDMLFLEKMLHKLLLNFAWWANRVDGSGNNLFEGGFLGLDNIGVIDRRVPLPDGTRIEQSDGTSWLASRCLLMMIISLELANHDRAYESLASKFLEHFVYLADALNNMGDKGMELWDDTDGFFYDALFGKNHGAMFMKVRSMVGIIPLFAVQTLDADIEKRCPQFWARLCWLLRARPELIENYNFAQVPGEHGRRIISLVNTDRLRRILQRVLDETEFLSPYGVRSISRYYKDHPYTLQFGGQTASIQYEPAESSVPMFGGNSNWRGPIWFPLNSLLIESLQNFHFYYGDEFKVECPTGSGNFMNLWQVSLELERRLVRIFMRDEEGRRPVYGNIGLFQSDPHWRDLILFHEYFNGDTGAGVGASHQTGWTALVAKMIDQHTRFHSPF